MLCLCAWYLLLKPACEAVHTICLPRWQRNLFLREKYTLSLLRSGRSKSSLPLPFPGRGRLPRLLSGWCRCLCCKDGLPIFAWMPISTSNACLLYPPSVQDDVWFWEFLQHLLAGTVLGRLTSFITVFTDAPVGRNLLGDSSRRWVAVHGVAAHKPPSITGSLPGSPTLQTPETG